MTLNDFYDYEKGRAEEFIKRLAKVTRKSPNTIRRYLSGRTPDRLTLEILAVELHTAPEELFPKIKLNTPKQ